MSDPVQRWLETFNCRQYAELIERSGYETLQQVCQLTPATLSALGITSPIDIEKITENVSVLRQTLQIDTQTNYAPYEPYTPTNTIETSTPVSTPKPKKNLKSQKSASSIDGSTKSGKNTAPNVTIANNHGGKSGSRSHKNKAGANTEAAKQIASDFLQMSKNQNVNTGYTYVELSTLQNKINQPQYHQYEKMNNSNPISYKQPYESSSYSDSWSSYNQMYSNSPLESLERLVALPETQVIDPKSVVNDADNHHVSYDYSAYQSQNKRVNMNDDNLSSPYSSSEANKKLRTINSSGGSMQQQVMPMQQQAPNVYAQNNQYYEYNNTANTFYAPMNQYPPPPQQQQIAVAPQNQPQLPQTTNQYYNQSQYNQVPYQENSFSSPYQIETNMGQNAVDYGQTFSSNSGYVVANNAQQPYVNQYDQQNQQYYSY